MLVASYYSGYADVSNTQAQLGEHIYCYYIIISRHMTWEWLQSHGMNTALTAAHLYVQWIV